jgi:hypothetical protein
VSADKRLWDPDPQVRLHAWNDLARTYISAETCDRLARHGFTETAAGLLRARGDLK